MKGKIIVIEGACDGIGKTTQFNLLKNELEKTYFHHFPSYNEFQGRGVEEYLKGNFGEINSLSNYFVNNLYAYDRAVTWHSKLKKLYEEGNTLLFDRYTTSSLIYQSTLIEDIEEKKKFIDFVVDYEYNKLEIGKPDVVIFLKAPYEFVLKMRNDRLSNEGITNDIHEANDEYMKKVYENSLFVSKYLNFIEIDCVRDGKFKSIEDIHKEIIDKINN